MSEKTISDRSEPQNCFIFGNIEKKTMWAVKFAGKCRSNLLTDLD